MGLNYLEHIEDESPSISGCSLTSARSVRTFLLKSPSANDLQSAIIEILGDTTISPSADGRLQRTPPLADPCFPFWYASNIPNIKGVGQYTKEAAEDELEVPPFPFFALYDQYWFTVEFTPRPFPILLDNTINKVKTGSWYNFAGTKQTFSYVTEWWRYFDFDMLPQFNSVTSQQGQMVFQSTNNCVNGTPYTAGPKMNLPDSLLRIVWYQVPYRFISSSNSYITRWQGCINQNAWNGYPAGSLLFLGYNPKKYTPPIQQEYPFAPGIFSTDKLCDIELTFLYTNRTATDLTGAPTNKNFIQSGHNLQPWLSDRGYHFAMSNPQATSNCPVPKPTPSWYSFPLELMFTDPDSANSAVSNF